MKAPQQVLQQGLCFSCKEFKHLSTFNLHISRWPRLKLSWLGIPSLTAAASCEHLAERQPGPTRPHLPPPPSPLPSPPTPPLLCPPSNAGHRAFEGFNESCRAAARSRYGAGETEGGGQSAFQKPGIFFGFCGMKGTCRHVCLRLHSRIRYSNVCKSITTSKAIFNHPNKPQSQSK